MMQIRVPASTSNLGSGFDTFGLALQLFLTVRVKFASGGEPRISYSGEGADSIALDESNLVYWSAKKFFERVGRKMPPLEIEIDNPIPLARGLGSSGSAAVAGFVAANELLKKPMSRDEILSLAIEREGHPENVSASLLGGLTISCMNDKDNVTRSVAIEQPLKAVVVIPEVYISTYEARRALPKQLPHKEAVFNVQRSALLSYAFLSGEFGILREVMQDKLHQPYRKKLIPGYDAFEKAGYENGALGVGISGSGSTILAFTMDHGTQIRSGWEKVGEHLGIPARTLELEICNRGAEVIL